MDQDDLRGLKYYIACTLVVIGFFVYSGMTGWKWFNPTKTEPTRPPGGQRPGYYHRYHK